MRFLQAWRAFERAFPIVEWFFVPAAFVSALVVGANAIATAPAGEVAGLMTSLVVTTPFASFFATLALMLRFRGSHEQMTKVACAVFAFMMGGVFSGECFRWTSAHAPQLIARLF